MVPRISVAISTHNPDVILFDKTLRALAEQTLPINDWELVIVDNASIKPLNSSEIQWCRGNCRIIREERLGLTYGRIAGVQQSRGDIVVFVDDDNILARDYLQNALRILDSDLGLGIVGGVIEPVWCDAAPEPWAAEFLWALALRNHGDSVLVGRIDSDSKEFPYFAPIGAGMVARRAALANWIADAGSKSLPGRRGTELTSCEDTEMVFQALRSNWSVGYFPELKVKHLIPGRRLRADYLARLHYEGIKSWVEVSYKYGICPIKPLAPWIVPLQALRAYWRYRAWQGPAEYIRWRHACGIFNGQAAIFGQQRVLT
jgi:glycosyltransferase involved in cell wall biosynthesis